MLLVDPNQFSPSVKAFEVDDEEQEVDLDSAFDDLVELIGERNFDLYDVTGEVVMRI